MIDPPKQRLLPTRVLEWLNRLPPLLLFIAALVYYGIYFRHWFNPHDEGGTAALIAQRIIQGERPIVDVFLGYNLMWFYPVVWLFQLFGVNYVLMRVYFFALSTLTAFLGYGITRRVTGCRWYALGIGVLLVLFPGSQFKNYIPLLGMANAWCLVRAFAGGEKSRRAFWIDLAIGGLVLALSYLIRIEIAIFFSVIWAGMFVLQLFDRRRRVMVKLGIALAGPAMLAAIVLAAHQPFYYDAKKRGFAEVWMDDYAKWSALLHGTVARAIDTLFSANEPPGPHLQISHRPAIPPAPRPLSSTANGYIRAANPEPVAIADPAAAPEPPAAAPGEADDRGILQRRPFSDIWRSPDPKFRSLAFLTYAPLLGFGVFLITALAGLAADLFRRAFTTANRSSVMLILVGASLTTFPQFWFFRPDRPHLAEFMVGYIAAAGCCAFLLLKATQPRWLRAASWLLALFLVGHLGIYAQYAFDHPSAGTIAARYQQKRKTFFAGENGVRVYVAKKEFAFLDPVRQLVLKFSKPGDYLICYPYMPGFNLMTNRRTYERNLYVDNNTRSANWNEEAIDRIVEKQPAVIAIDNREINQNPASAFSVWAAPAYAFIRQKYHHQGTFGRFEIYTRSNAPVQ